MASAKSRRYGNGGSNHKHNVNHHRENGKAWKSHPKAFSTISRRLVTVGDSMKGDHGPILKF